MQPTIRSSVKKLSTFPNPSPQVFYSCGGRDGTYMIASSARRQLMMNNSVLLLRIPGIGILQHPKHPDTTFFTTTDKTWHAEGLEIDMVEPMKQGQDLSN